jgi:hypothetical protein
VTTIVEKKSEFGFIFGFLAVVLGFAAWRGLENATVVAGLLGLGAIGCAAILVYWYRKPAPILTITPDEIWYGRLDQEGMRIERNETGRLLFKQGFDRSGWFLLLADEPEKPGLLMTGFNMPEVAAAVTAHGWTFS